MDRLRARTSRRVLDHQALGRRGLFAALLAVAISFGIPTGTGAASSGAPPVLTALSAKSGELGQTITLSGTGFFSANGLIVATFGTHPAPTQCPTRKECFVTVPTRAKLSGVYKLRLHTESGTSNAFSFKVL